MLQRKRGHPVRSGWHLERLQAGGICPVDIFMGICPTGSAAQNWGPYFAMGASNSPQQWKGGADLPPREGERGCWQALNSSLPMGTAMARLRRAFWDELCRYPLARTSTCACSGEKATLSLKLQFTALLSPQK